jgi:hypothetical protein
MCREEVLSNILESPLIDTNTKIAFMIARQVGWPVDFEHEGDQTKFRMIVPCKAIDDGITSEVKADQNLQLKPDQNPAKEVGNSSARVAENSATPAKLPDSV